MRKGKYPDPEPDPYLRLLDPRIAQKHADPGDPDPDPQRYFVTVCGVDVRVTKFIILKFKDSNSLIN
jgi:hypothetical protein